MKIQILLLTLSQGYNVKNEAFGDRDHEIDLMDLGESIFDRIARDTEGSGDSADRILFTENEIESTSTPLVTRTAINLNSTESEVESQKEVKSLDENVDDDLVLEESLENETSDEIEPTVEPLLTTLAANETTTPAGNVTTTPAAEVTTAPAGNVTTTAAPESAALPLATSIFILIGALLF